jgi:hypothetical protein
MSELAVLEPEYITLSTDIENLVEMIKRHELSLATGYVRLGRLLREVQLTKEWRKWGFGSFGQYVDFIREKIDRSRASIYGAVSTVDRLLPSVSEEDMERMGASRAAELAAFVKKSGRKVPPKLLEAALDGRKKLSELHVEIMVELHDKSQFFVVWFEPLGGSYYEKDEKEEVLLAIKTAKNMAAFAKGVPEHVQNKEIMLMFVREFLSSNSVHILDKESWDG